MKKLLLIFILSLFPSVIYANTFIKTKIDGIDFKYVEYKIWSDEYKIKTLISDDAISLEDLAVKNNVITAINGVFFCPSDYPQCKGKSYTINERFKEGQDLSHYVDTWARWVFAWDSEEVPFIHQTNSINSEKRDDIFEWLGNFPVLYADGKNMLENYHDSGLYDIKMKTPLPRHFICSNEEKSKIIFGRTWSVSLDNLAPILYKLGCWDALNLDAWNSSQYIYNGRTLVSGPRKILDWFWIERIWFDVQNIETKLDKLFPLFIAPYKKISTKRKIERYEEFLTLFPQARTRIYNRNSHNIYDEQWVQIGYQINTSDLKEIRKIYVYNWLEQRMREEIFRLRNSQLR